MSINCLCCDSFLRITKEICKGCKLGCQILVCDNCHTKFGADTKQISNKLFDFSKADIFYVEIKNGVCGKSGTSFSSFSKTEKD